MISESNPWPASLAQTLDHLLKISPFTIAYGYTRAAFTIAIAGKKLGHSLVHVDSRIIPDVHVYK